MATASRGRAGGAYSFTEQKLAILALAFSILPDIVKEVIVGSTLEPLATLSTAGFGRGRGRVHSCNVISMYQAQIDGPMWNAVLAFILSLG